MKASIRTYHAMKNIVLIPVVLLLIFAAVITIHSETIHEPPTEKLYPTATSGHFKLIGEAINQPGYDIWGSSPVRDENGKVHVFCARWPSSIPFEVGWRFDSEIAHYVAEHPEGPFEFLEVIASSDKIQGTWNRAGFHNPHIRRIDSLYVLVYIANDGTEPHGPKQAIGMMIADDIHGPWVQVPDENTPILQTPSNSSIWCYGSGSGVNNPSILAHPNGKYYLYFKGMSGPRPQGRVSMGVAIADQLTGPYVIQQKPITSNNNKAIEDGYAFIWRNHVCLLTTDNHGILEFGGGLLWISKDGITFNDQPLSGFHHFGNHYLNGNIPQNANMRYGGQVKFERPQLLMDIDGEIGYLYCPSGVAIDGSDGTNSYVLKFTGNQ